MACPLPSSQLTRVSERGGGGAEPTVTVVVEVAVQQVAPVLAAQIAHQRTRAERSFRVLRRELLDELADAFAIGFEAGGFAREEHGRAFELAARPGHRNSHASRD